MFPTFISILDIQSWWEVPSIAHFCSLFRTAFNLLDFDIEDLEEALLTDGTEEASWLQELIVKLLTGCLPNNEISTFNYQMFLRRLFREKCKEHDRYNPFNTDIDFQLLPLRTKVDILYALCDFRLDSDDVLEQLKNLEADSLRVVPLGYDNNESAYWYFYGTRLYREDFNTKTNKKGKSVWQVVCFTEEDWFQLAKKFKKSSSKSEKQLFCTLSENFLPELHRLFSEKERLARKRLLENQPRRTSSRLDTKRKQEQTKQSEDSSTKKEDKPKIKVDDELKKKRELERRRQEAYERRSRIREGQGSESDGSKSRYEMGGKQKEKKPKPKPRKHSSSSSSSRDRGSVVRSSSRTVNKNETTAEKTKTTAASPTKANNPNNSTSVGRQTNNSLASATGQIVIQPVSNPHRKKLKTSLVFRQTDEDLQTGMHKILDYVKNHDDAWPFVDPVEEEYAPNYYSVIRKPMDLQKMEERLDAGYYKSYSRFRGDFQLIVDNCRLYNGAENEYTEMVGNLLNVFEKATDRYLDQITSSDEEIAVEFPDNKPEDKMNPNKDKVANLRKPTLAAHTDKKREPSFSEDSTSKQSSHTSLDVSERIKNLKKQLKRKNVEDTKLPVKKEKTVAKVDVKIDKKKEKKKKVGRKPGKSKPITPKARSRSRSFSSLSREEWDSSPPPSSVPTSPDSIYNKKDDEPYEFSDEELHSKIQGKGKQRSSYKDHFDKINKKISKYREHSLSPPKQKEHIDKHNKLRETIEKLKAKSEISSKFKENLDNESNESQEGHKKFDKSTVNKTKFKKFKTEKITESDDESNTIDSTHFDRKPIKKENKNSGNNIKYEALTLATEQTLKDINKWLDGTAQSSEFSSASNSPSHDVGEEFDSLGNKKDFEYRKRFDKPSLRKDALSKDLKRRTFHRDPAKFLKKREIQRTIDRLQPGKSKGNLLSNVQNTNKVDELFPIGILAKIKDTRNSLIVKTNESAPKLSLGSVLDSFGKHKFLDDAKKEEGEKKLPVEEPVTSVVKSEDVEVVKSKVPQVEESDEKKVPEPAVEVPVSNESTIGKATPNLSAWFKAFGAPKVIPNQKKPDSKSDTKDCGKSEDSSKIGEEKSKSESLKVISPEISPNPDSPAAPQGHPIPRQRKMSTGSTVSERSSFSQDMDSPRVCIDERLGAYPAPYPSPLHRSPSGASPIMASPRPDISPKSAYPTVNGQIRVGFYQDTVSTKSSPDKSCSPRSNPQSPYPQYSEPVYTPSTTESAVYSYNNSYYSQIPNYSNPPTPSYNTEQGNHQSTTYYDTTKPITDQYQAKPPPAYHAVNSPNYQNVHSPNYSAPPNTSNYHATVSPSAAPQLHSPSSQQTTNYESLQPQPQATRMPEKSHPSAMFPVKKRIYNETDTTVQLPNNQPTEHLSYERNYNVGLAPSNSLGLPPSNPSPQLQELRPSSRSATQQYVHQNIPNPRSSNTRTEIYAKSSNLIPQIPISSTRDIEEGMRNVNNFNSSSNLYNYNESNYGVNTPVEGPLDLNARQDPKKIDMSKYTNMGYSGTDIGFSRNPPQYNLNYGRPPSTLASKSSELQAPVPTNAQNIQNNEMMMRYNEAADYRNINSQKPTPHATNISIPQNTENRLLDVSNSFKPDMPIPRPGYSTPSGLNVDQSLGLRSNLPNLSHIVDRFSADNVYYSDKGLPGPHIYAKPMATSASNIPMFSQSSIAMPYNHEMQATQSSLYNRQMTELQSSIANQAKAPSFPQQPEKKSKRRKNSKVPPLASNSAEPVNSAVSNQGFQSYTGLKNTSSIEPSAISLKTASVVPGSAFNFGPTPTGLGLSSGLYGEKDTYPNFLEDYRSAPNYYMAAAAAAAHHRSTPDTGDKQSRTSHQPSPSAAAGYPFIGAPQPRPPSYPLSGSFMSPHQTPPLMDPSSPLYQQYLQAGVLHQGLLGPPGGYPPSYHPALSMRQPFDSMTRPWL